MRVRFPLFAWLSVEVSTFLCHLRLETVMDKSETETPFPWQALGEE
jgi:hypothetical protein